MQPCEFEIEGRCEIASKLSGIPCDVNAVSCEACHKHASPCSKNPITIGLARDKLRSSNLPYAHLYPAPIATRLGSQDFSDVIGKPGSSLKSILHAAGVFGSEGCGCDNYAALMDRWGVNTCEERFDEIVSHLNSQKVSWFDIFRVAKAGYLTTGSLVQAAIDKARQ